MQMIVNESLRCLPSQACVPRTQHKSCLKSKGERAVQAGMLAFFMSLEPRAHGHKAQQNIPNTPM